MMKLRVINGVLMMEFDVSTEPTIVVSVLNSGASPVTWTDSASVPSSSVRSTRALWFSSSVTSGRTIVLKPLASTFSS